MKRHARALIGAALYLLFVLYAIGTVNRAQEPVTRCEGLPPVYGDDC